MDSGHPGLNHSHPALHWGPPGPSPNAMLPVPGEYKAFILCFMYYAKDFDPNKSRHIDPEDCSAAVSDILKHQHNLDIQPDHILAYYREAIVNARRSGHPTWGYVVIATYMADQVQDDETVKRITSFELNQDVISSNYSNSLMTSDNSYVKVAKLSQKGNEVLAHARQRANTYNPPNHVRSHWNLFKEHPDWRDAKIVDPVLLGQFVETPTFPSDTSSQLAAAADRTLEKSSSSSSEGDAS